jgi:hypothetical protein
MSHGRKAAQPCAFVRVSKSPSFDAPNRQAGGHWFEPSAAHSVKATQSGPWFRDPPVAGREVGGSRRALSLECEGGRVAALTSPPDPLDGRSAPPWR